MLDRLDFTENKYEELSIKIGDPLVIANQKNGKNYVKNMQNLK